MNNVYLGLGSNVADRERFINSALLHLNEDKGCKVLKTSSFYETRPYGKTDQSNFINTAVLIHTSHNPLNLFKLIKSIENKVGRIKRERWGPREIDIDILFYANELIESDELTIPHADIINRGFVLLPILEINPSIIHPKTKKLLKEYLDTNKENDILRIWNNDFNERQGKQN
jgi:2-amino-4-hydroxy-6-hydroxymethyldihydropteridine diphosphokinase